MAKQQVDRSLRGGGWKSLRRGKLDRGPADANDRFIRAVMPHSAAGNMQAMPFRQAHNSRVICPLWAV